MIVKRGFDIVVSLLLLILLSPLLLVLSLLIVLDSKGGVFFLQERAGKDKKIFKIYKFRTMVPNAIHMGLGVYTEENDPRITRIGRFLRKTSLDELPQLFNILRGDMSVIGPRPTLPYQVEQYDEFQLRRLQVLPGVTGLAQVHGRNSLSWPERIRLDVWYVDHWSLWLDIRILFKTVLVIFKREGIYGQKENFIIKNNEELKM